MVPNRSCSDSNSRHNLPLTSCRSLSPNSLFSASPSASGFSEITGDYFKTLKNSLNSDSDLVSPSPGSSKPAIVHKWNLGVSVLCIASAPERGLLFCGTQDSKIVVFDLESYQQKFELKGHAGAVLCLTASPDEKYLFSGGSDSLIKVWDIDSMKETHTIYSLVDIGDIFSVAWSSRLNTVFFGAQNASILYAQILDTSPSAGDPRSLPSYRFDKFFDSKGPGGHHGNNLKPHNNQHRNLQRQEEQKTIDTTLVASTRLIEVPSQNIISYAHNGYVYAMRLIERDSKCDYLSGIPIEYKEILISAGGDGFIRIWGFNEITENFTFIKELDNNDSVLSMTLDETFLYCGLTDGEVKVWDLSTYQVLKCFQTDDNEGNIFSLAVHNGCLFKATKYGVTKWKIRGDQQSDWDAHEGFALAVQIIKRKGNFYLITGGMDKSLAIWNINQVNDSETEDDDNNRLAHRGSISSLTNDSLLETLREMISFKTVSKQPEYFIDDSRRCANFLRALFTKFGAKTSKLIPVNDGNPVVFAEFKGKIPKNGNAKPRILWYGHYDVVEADDLRNWNTSPFKLTAENGYLYGRGVTDNKGPLMAAIYAVAELFQEGALYSDILFLIEGEEECGSFGLKDAIVSNNDQFGEIDWVLLSNSCWLDDKIPCLNYGLRGLVSLKVEIFNDKPDRHSGVDGVDGRFSKEPTIDLINLLSKLTNDDGKIMVPGFYDPIREVTKDEMKLYENIMSRSSIESSIDQLMAKWRYPSLTVHNISVSGPGNSTIIPHSASASLSIRVVPDQDVFKITKMFTEYLTKCFENSKTENHLDISIVQQSEPWLGDPSSVAFQILKEEIETEWSIEPLFVREGGSIPSVRFLEKNFKCPVVQVPSGQSTDNAHLGNENLRVINLYKTRNILKRSFTKLPNRT
ncbi:hypothetical protein PACTADRAFT_48793 [Pachysolen tannophilus NRRL Y-2460]|uniref:Peptidase M20 dimerisation domain-containing protein n=1 Tax=Pachysolen tannophilus NRRL Y-2460 TaxID=669874 RepID=A0A1E4TZ54_PACTA|nr:hypothetical protein PACTADRAFT_48793 [Pachysolen tannophilus NRRL Y-2460]